MNSSPQPRWFALIALLAAFLCFTLPARALVNADYNTAGDIPVTSNGYTATGETVAFSLNFAPETGQQLTVVNNTALGFISGTFDNLAQGELVNLGFDGFNYQFVANYYGGSGNDLVLVWAGTRPFGWGLNNEGQIGDGTVTDRLLPTPVNNGGVLAGKTVLSVASGFYHTLFLCSDGTLAACGSNDYGQLGDDSFTDRVLPVAVKQDGVLSGKTVVAIAAGGYYSLVLCSDGTVAGWGYNFQGQLGNGGGGAEDQPVLVDQGGVLSGKTVVAIAAGDYSSLALCSDGTMASWGRNNNGQLGDNALNFDANAPEEVEHGGVLPGKTVMAISSGSNHSLVLCSDGTLAAWGANFGQLGDGTFISRNQPVLVDMSGFLSGKTVVGIGGGDTHSLVFCSDGTVATWGQNAAGQLGDGTTFQQLIPVAVDASGVLSGRSVVSVNAGKFFSIVTCSDGSVVVWGANDYGQFGDGTTTGSLVPVLTSQSTLSIGERFIGSFGSGDRSSYALVAPGVSEIGVFNGASTALPDLRVSGGPAVDFGTTDIGGAPSATQTFTIENTGTATLQFSLNKTGANQDDFILTSSATSLLPNTSTTFTLTFAATGIGARSAALEIVSNDNDESPFVINLSGTGNSFTLNASYAAAGDVPLNIAGLTATGNTVNFSLNFTPQTGTDLMVVENTGSNEIGGTFTGLAQGQLVSLSYQGKTYQFIADYFGGNGNDLVLLWAGKQLYGWGGNWNGQFGNGSAGAINLPAAINPTGALTGKTITRFVGGNSHSLALCADGTLAAAGYNAVGALGDGTTNSSYDPVLVDTTGVLNGKRVVMMAIGFNHSLVLCSDGTIATFGQNTQGQLGNGTNTDSNVPLLVDVSGVLSGKKAISVFAGGNYSGVLCQDGTIATWGEGNSGQLGNGVYGFSNVPVLVERTGVLAGKTVVEIAPGASHSLVWCSDGTLAAWGHNGLGQLGNGTNTSSNVPVLVDQTGVMLGKTVAGIVAGGGHSLAYFSDGTIAAWGYNLNGQLGDASNTDRNAPVLVNTTGVLNGRQVVGVAAANDSSLVLCSDGTLAAWGQNGVGQYGDGTINTNNVPVQSNLAGLPVGGLFTSIIGPDYGEYFLGVFSPGVAQISVFNGASTAPPDVRVSGSGNVDFGSLLAGTTSGTQTFTIQNSGTATMNLTVTLSGSHPADFIVSSIPPTLAPGASVTIDVNLIPSAAGSRSAVVEISSNSLNTSPFLINVSGTATSVNLTPNYVTGNEVPLSTNGFAATGSTVSFTLGFAPEVGAELMVVENTGPDFIAGAFAGLAQGQTVALVHAGTTYQFVANYYGGTGNDLVLIWAGTRPYAWGYNSRGQLGTNDTGSYTTPAKVVDVNGVFTGRTVVQFATGFEHSLALCADGTLAAWGYNGFGQLGDGTNTDRYVPVLVNAAGALAGKTVVNISAGQYHSLAVCSDGTVVAWGLNGNGQLGDGGYANSNVPVAVSMTGALAGKKVKAISAGREFSLALCTDGTVAGWGSNSYGQLGDGTYGGTPIPVAVDRTGVLSGRTVIGIATGLGCSAALCSDGSVVSWGLNNEGELGDGTGVQSNVPVAVDVAGVLSGKTVTRIAAGVLHTVALCSDGTLVGWGYNGSGQVGNNSNINVFSPVLVNDLSGVLTGKTVTGVTAGAAHSIAFCLDGTVAAWGDNGANQLGNGTFNPSLTPVNVSIGVLPVGGRFTKVASSGESAFNLGLFAPGLSEIRVFDGVSTAPPDERQSNTGTFLMTDTQVGTATPYTFTIQNTGPAELSGLDVTMIGADAGEFTVVSLGATTLQPGTDTTLVVSFTPTSIGTKNAVIRIASNDTDENPFLINVSGEAIPLALNATYTTGLEVPVNVPRLTAAGSTANFVLDHAPVAGAQLMVVQNTGLDFISGQFDNLAHGQLVTLGHDGTLYEFIANYYGGTGNDLVLMWANTQVFAWGSNSDGELGESSFANQTVPTPITSTSTGVLAGKTIIATSTGEKFTLLLCSDGTVASIGRNANGQLGDNTVVSSVDPVLVDTTGVLAGKTVVAIDAGRSHSLALCSDGTVFAWGANERGQLGINTTVDEVAPVQVHATGVLAGKTVVAISAGYDFSLALCSDGTLAAWGRGLRVGNDVNFAGDIDSLTPIPVETTGVLAGKLVVAIAAGGYHSLALCSDGTVVAWGLGTNGQLGDNLATSVGAPVVVNAANGVSTLFGKTVTALSAGSLHSVALCSDGSLAVWGNNDGGQLGDGSITTRIVPSGVDVSGVLSGLTVSAISAGFEHSLVLCSNGTLAAWGSDMNGVLGNGIGAGSLSPVLVDVSQLGAGERFTQMSSGSLANHQIALVAKVPQTEIALFEGNSTAPANELSSGDTFDFGSSSIGVSNVQTFTIQNAGMAALSGVALSKTGSDPADFKLSSVSTTVRGQTTTTFTVTYTPTALGSRSALVEIASNDLDENPFQFYVEGTSVPLTLNATYTTGAEVPVTAEGIFLTGSTASFTLNHTPATGSQLMVVKNTSLAFINGAFDNLAHGQLVTLSHGGKTYSFVANYYGGDGNDLVLVWAGLQPYTWGANFNNQLGDGTFDTRLMPVALNQSGALSGKTVLSVVSGPYHTLALCSDGTVVGWGYNAYGQLGNGNTMNSPIPVVANLGGVLSGKTVVAIAAGGLHSMALCSDGTLAAWGYNFYGQLGDGNTGDSLLPVLVNTAGVLSGKQVVSISAGRDHSLVLCSDGTAAAWGNNASGELGNGTTNTSFVPAAVDVSGVLSGRKLVSVVAGEYFNLGLCADGSVVGWGQGYSGQLGNGGFNAFLSPVLMDMTGVLNGKTVVSLAGGNSFSLVLCSDGTVAGCGQNAVGQLGDGTTNTTALPVLVNTTGVLNGKTVVSISAGSNHGLATCSDGTAVTWGYNLYGQLGDNTTNDSLVPVLVNTANLAVGDRFVLGHRGITDAFSAALVASGIPEIEVYDGLSTLPANERQDNVGTFAFGNGQLGAGEVRSFTIRNDGTGTLGGFGLSVSGANASEFEVNGPSDSTVVPGGTTTFTVTFRANSAGAKNAVIHLASTDVDEASFEIPVSGTGVTMTLSATYNAAADVPLTTDGLIATGSTVNFTLNHVPVTGAQLMVVRNTAISWIGGAFDNLAHGQLVYLSFGGVSYGFVANYYGGTGNDLVLVWSGQHAYAWGSDASGVLGIGGGGAQSVPVMVNRAGVLNGKTVLGVVGGFYHAMAVCSDGTVAGWGFNNYGQIGDGTTTEAQVPVALSMTGALSGKTAVAVACGSFHTVVLCSDGTLAAFGYNGHGQLGDGTNTDSTTPVAVNMAGVLNGRNVVSIAAGDVHSLALCSDGTVVAWGIGSQLGDGINATSNVPVEVVSSGVLSGKKVESIVAGSYFSLALCKDGTVAGWGSSFNGELGNGATSNYSSPVLMNMSGVLSGKTVTGIAAGQNFSVVLCSDGTLAASGDNGNGQLGDGTNNPSSVPVLVDRTGVLSGKTATSIASGRNHATVVCSDGTVAAWGDNQFGQLGDGTNNDNNVPVLVNTFNLVAGDRVTQTQKGFTENSSFVLVASGLPEIQVYEGLSTLPANERQDNDSVFAFGNGQLGIGEVRSFTIKNNGTGVMGGFGLSVSGTNAAEFEVNGPVLNSLAPGGTTTFTVTFRPVIAGARNAVIHLASSDADETSFEIPVTGTGATTTLNATYNASTNVPLTADGFIGTGSTVNITLNHTPATGAQLMVVNNTGLAWIGGAFDNLAQGQLVNLSFGGFSYPFVANYYGGTGNDLVLVWAGQRPFAWGGNGASLLGNGTGSSSAVPVEVDQSGILNGKTVISVSSARYQVFAICADGTLVGWGENGFGQLGDGTNNTRNSPVAVSMTGALTGKTVVAVAGGDSHTVALCSDGTLAAWGYNGNGQLGDNTTTDSLVPVAVDMTGVLSGKQVVSVAAGQSHSVVLCSDGTVAVWGYGGNGQLGNGTTGDSSVPVAVNVAGVLNGRKVTSISCGTYFTMGLCTDGNVVGWGGFYAGELGDGGTGTYSLPALMDRSGVLNGKTVVGLAAGLNFSVVLCSDGTVATCGDNFYGQLGNGTNNPSSLPVLVDTTGVLSSKTVVSISAGKRHVLGVCPDGTAVAWGLNLAGELGDETTTNRNSPVSVTTSSFAVGDRIIEGFSGCPEGLTIALVASGVPEIEIYDGLSTAPANERQDNVGSFGFGNRQLGFGVTQSFTIRNIGTGVLGGFGLSVNGANASEFTVSGPVNDTVAPNGTTTFTVIFRPGSTGLKNAVIQLASSDVTEASFEIPVSGTGTTMTLNATYNAATDVPLTVDGLIATGSTVNFTLGHVPATGAQLMVVSNTGIDWISGSFDNLAQGQLVNLSHGGVDYQFVANYFGGDGNDLVLVWAGQRIYGWGYNSDGELGDGTTNNSNLPVATSQAGVLNGKTVLSVSAGAYHTLALCSDGTMAAWGYNGVGELGDGTTTSSLVPVAVSFTGALSGKTVVAVAASYRFSLALCSDGTVAAWGYNSNGQLGDGTTTDNMTPVAVETSGVLSGKKVVSIAAGLYHSVALCSDGTVAAWGYNGFGQLGNGINTDSSVPVAVDVSGALSGKKVKAIAAGGFFSLGLCADGSVAGWGFSYSGQLGTGTSTAYQAPVLLDMSGVLSGKAVVKIAAGESFSLILCSDGTLAATGDNGFGQLGDGTTTSTNLPVLVSTAGVLNGRTPISISGGKYHALALCLDGGVVAWGYNDFGQLGDATNSNSVVPVEVSNTSLVPGERFTSVSSGNQANQTLALVAQGIPDISVFTGASTAPIDLRVSGGAPVAFADTVGGGISATQTFTIKNTGTALLGGLALSTAGTNPGDFVAGNLGATSLAPNATTTFTIAFSPTALGSRSGVVRIASDDTDENPFEINVSGTGIPITLNANYTTGNEIPLTQPGLVATGSTVSFTLNYAPVVGTDLMVVKTTGIKFINGTFPGLAQGQTVILSFGGVDYPFVANYYGGDGNDLVLHWAVSQAYAWGYGGYGALGDGSGNSSNVLTAVDRSGVLAGKTVVSLSAGDFHSLALCSDGTLAAWGKNESGQLGDGTTTSSSVPVAVDTTGALSGKTVVGVVAGYYFSTALCSDGTVVSWGENEDGQLGDGTTTDSLVPVAVDTTGVLSGKTVTRITSGYGYCLALCSDGSVIAWGRNNDGQLANAIPVGSLVPVLSDLSSVLTGRTVVSIASGNNHNLAILSDGRVAGWGYNGNGQLGNGSNSGGAVPSLVDGSGVLSGKTVVSIGTGVYLTQALCSDGTVASWGYNAQGQLGDGTNNDSNVPVAVDTSGVLSGKTVTSIATGYFHGMARCSDGTTVAWGWNSSGQLGDGTNNDRNVPVLVDVTGLPAGRRLTHVFGGFAAYHSLALVASPAVSEIEVFLGASADPGDEVQTSYDLEFPNVLVGTSTATQTFTIKNIGALPLSGLVVTKGGTNPGDFTITAVGSSTLNENLTTTFTVAFSPASVGAKSATIQIASNDLDEDPFVIDVTGLPDVTTPSLSNIAITSNNVADAGWAKIGDTIMLSFTADEPLATPTVTIGGQSATVINPSGYNWLATLTVGAGTTEGSDFSIAFGDPSGNNDTATATTDSTSVTIDRTAPGILISLLPPAFEATSASGAVVTFSSSASDNLGTANLIRSHTSGSTFPIGVTTVNLSATDTAGNTHDSSFTVTVLDTTAPVLSVPANIVVGATTTDGAIVTFTPTATDAVSTPVIVATPASGSLFAFGTTTVNVTATDDEGLVSTGSFTVTVQPFAKGIYNGLATPTLAATAPGDNVGAITLTVLPTGKFTGKLKLGGTSKVVALKGLVGNDGAISFGTATASTSTINIVRDGKATLTLALNLDRTVMPDTGVLVGTLKEPGNVTVATINADRALYTSKIPAVAPLRNVPVSLLNPATDKGKYTVIVQAKTPAEQGMGAGEFPQGDGWAQLTVLKTGVVKVVGKLADGTSFSCAQPLSENNEWPFYVALYKGKGTISGVVSFRDVADESDADGLDLRWFKPANPLDKLYRNGWGVNGILTDFFASKYVPPAKDSNQSAFLVPGEILPSIAQNGSITIADGLLTADLMNDVSISSTSKVTVLTPFDIEALKCSISAKTGVMTGSFKHPVSLKSTAFKGVILQKKQLGAGYFIGLPAAANAATITQESGSVSLVPE